MPSDLKVGIVTFDDGDFEAFLPAVDLLENLGVSHELVAIGPHETFQRVVEYAERARDRGLSLIIAGTGDAPDLPSMLARYTSLPVLGVPLRCKILGGEEPPYSLVEMPPDTPVATVALGDVRGAAIVAVRILALGDENLSGRLKAFRERQERTAQKNGDIA